MYFVRFTGSGELSMNGQLLQEDKVYPFSQGSSIKGYKIKPIYYWDVTMQFLKEEFKSSRVVYEVNNIEYRFKSGAGWHSSYELQGRVGKDGWDNGSQRSRKINSSECSERDKCSL